MNKEFLCAFQINKKIIFEVNYYTLSSNKTPYFTTSANEFNQPKTDWNRCGQAQKELLIGKAMSFYKKWDYKHLHDLTESEYNEMIDDLNKLKEIYNYMEIGLDETQRPYSPHFNFYRLKEFSKQKLK